ncbi:MAG: TonB-dependent receptor [Prevotella sp.]|nr:TonB-dependent receptor [Prevotella sp.]
MTRFMIFFLLMCCTLTASAQGQVKGKVLDKKNNEPVGFVTIRVSHQDSTDLVKGSVTDLAGNFRIEGLPDGLYTLSATYVGYRDLKRNFKITDKNRSVRFPLLYLSGDSRMLKEVTVTGQKATVKLEVDRKSFDVSQLISNSGEAATDVLENIPSVEVDNDGNIFLRGNESVEVWINGKASGLTSDNRAQILQQLPAESIDHIEVIDNPSAKYSAEGSAGIINIVLKKDRKAGYYGSVQGGVDTRGGASSSFNFNYNNKSVDAYLNVGYRHLKNQGQEKSEQNFLKTGKYQNYDTHDDKMGNNLFSRAGITWHATSHDDLSLSGMMMTGKFKDWSTTPYHNGISGGDGDSYLLSRYSHSNSPMDMYYGEFDYRHNFSDKHFLNLTVDFNRWKADNNNYYQDSTVYFTEAKPTDYEFQYRPQYIRNRSQEVKLDYENQLTKALKLQAGYQGNFSHENTPQESYVDNTYWDGRDQKEDQTYFNRFIYDLDIHALYLTTQYQLGKWGIMGGLRGEYWKVNTESYTWEQEYDPSKRVPAFRKNQFQLFPSVFMSYQMTKNDQLQINYTRRLRRPWGGQLNSFKNTSDASIISYGNPELTPEYSHSFSFNYLRTWTEHSLLLSAYYQPTSDVIQRINYQSSADGLMYQTNLNVASSLSTGLEATLQDKLFRILDLTTNVNAYYYKLDGFNCNMDGQTIVGAGEHNFIWNARVMASLILPYGISLQSSAQYRSRQSIAQGYRKSNVRMDFSLRKNFFDKALVLSVSCHDLLNSRKFETYTSSETFDRYQLKRRGGRKVNFTLTWNFGNMKAKPSKPKQMPAGDENSDVEQGSDSSDINDK